MRVFFFLSILFSFFAETFAVPIETPDYDERNNFVVRSPLGWGYRTFKGENGLIGVFWPKGTTFNLTDTAIFIFLQDKNQSTPKKGENMQYFTGKCTKAKFRFETEKTERNPTKSLGEKYFRGRCGRTMVIIEEKVGPYNIILLIASAKRYITKAQLLDFKEIAAAYKREAEEYLENGGNNDDDEEDDEKDEEEEKEKNKSKAKRSKVKRKGSRVTY